MQPPASQGRGLYRLKPNLGGKVSPIGGVGALLVRLGKPEFLANGCKGFLRRADVTVTEIKGALVDGEARNQFAAVEIVLRKAREPQPRLKFVALLHEVAALVDFSQKQPDGNVFGDVAFDASKFAGGLIDPHKAAPLEEDGAEP